MKYVKKPVVVEAFEFGVDEMPEWFYECHKGYEYDFDSLDDLRESKFNSPSSIIINTLEGVVRAYPGDMIIKGIKGEIYPCKKDIFKATYEPIIGDYIIIPK